MNLIIRLEWLTMNLVIRMELLTMNLGQGVLSTEAKAASEYPPEYQLSQLSPQENCLPRPEGLY